MSTMTFKQMLDKHPRFTRDQKRSKPAPDFSGPKVTLGSARMSDDVRLALEALRLGVSEADLDANFDRWAKRHR